MLRERPARQALLVQSELPVQPAQPVRRVNLDQDSAQLQILLPVMIIWKAIWCFTIIPCSVHGSMILPEHRERLRIMNWCLWQARPVQLARQELPVLRERQVQQAQRVLLVLQKRQELPALQVRMEPPERQVRKARLVRQVKPARQERTEQRERQVRKVRKVQKVQRVKPVRPVQPVQPARLARQVL